MTPLLAGADGTCSIAQVNGITPAHARSELRDATSGTEMSWDAYRGNVRMETIARALEAAIVADATTGDKPQVHLAEIWLAGDPEAADDDSGKVRASHILYSPEDDPGAASSGSNGSAGGIPGTDPSWTVAQAEAGLASQELAGHHRCRGARRRPSRRWPRPTATTPAAAPKGGDLGYFDRDTMVREFADALFDHLDTLKPGDIVGPVKTDFGYHVIMFQDYQPPLADRLDALKTELAKPDADFAAIAKSTSDGAEAAHRRRPRLAWPRRSCRPRRHRRWPPWQPGAVSEPIALDDGYHVYQLIERADRPLDPAQVAELRTTAFDDWYDPQRDDAEASGAITRDDSIFDSGCLTAVR